MTDFPKMPEKLVEKVYDDLAHPAAKEVGSTLGRAVRVALSPARAVLWSWDRAEAWLERAVNERLERRKVPPERVQPPPAEVQLGVTAALQVAGPAADGELRELFANLLTSAVDASTAPVVHPSFVDILRQISSEDARVLRYMRERGAIAAWISARPGKADHEWTKATEREDVCPITPQDLGVTFTRHGGLREATDNLARLGLIHFSSGVGSQLGLALNAARAQAGQVAFGQGEFSLSLFGERFCEACVDDAPVVPDAPPP